MKFLHKRTAGFSLLELMVVVAIIGVLATFAVPRFNIFRARARQGEAKSNLGVIFTLQEAFKIDKEVYYNGNATAWGGTVMNSSTTSDGYRTKNAAGVCESNKLGFRLANCDAARYRYWIGHATENEFIAIAAAHSDASARNKRIFPGCSGSDVTAKKKPSTSDSAAELECIHGTSSWTGTPPAGADPEITEGDAFCLDHERKLDNFKDIVSAKDCVD